jgi:molecular chaperone HscB
VANPSSSDRKAPGAAAPARADDPFALLGLAPAYEVDPAALERAFFERSKALHPDRVAGAPAAERVAALSRSRALNDAYQLIKKPVSRAEYLLARAGVTIGDNERLEPAFLMEILELREELAEARAAGNRERVEALERAMKARRTEALDALPALFAAGDFQAIKHRLIVLRYIHRYLEECDAALDED